jgi:hypothetical protein
MDKQLFVDRILETENLTDELEDAEANWLINWGISQLDSLLVAVSDEEQAGEKVNALMATMRKLNRFAGRRQDKDIDDLAAELAGISGLFANTFDLDQEPTEEACQLAARQISWMESNLQVLNFLTRWGFRPASRM